MVDCFCSYSTFNSYSLSLTTTYIFGLPFGGSHIFSLSKVAKIYSNSSPIYLPYLLKCPTHLSLILIR